MNDHDELTIIGEPVEQHTRARSPLSVIDITAQTLHRLADESRDDAVLREELKLAEAHLNNASRHIRWQEVQAEEQRDLEAALHDEGRADGV